MTAVLAAFSLQGKIEQYGAYAGVAAVFGLGILSLLYFAQAREVKRLREWAGRAPERAAELEARVTADAQRRVTPAPVPTPAPRPAAPVTPAAQQSAPPLGPGVAAPATAAAAAAGAPATAVAKPGTTAPRNGTGSAAAVPAPGTEAKPQDGEAKKPGEPAAAPPDGPPKVFGPQPKPAEPEDKPAVPAVPAAATAAAAAAAAAAPAPRPAAPLRAPSPSTALPPRTPAGTRPRPDADDGPSRGRIAAIVGGVVAAIAVVAVAAFLLFGGSGGDKPTPKPNTVAQPSGATTGSAGGSTPPKTPAAVDRKAVPLAVLNGTTVTGLARGAADKLTKKGYNEPNVVTNDTTNQARPTTQIYYEAKARAAALDVAKILGVPTAQVKAMDANARALADRAQVAVFVGADKAQ